MRPCDRCMTIVSDRATHELRIGKFGDYLVCDRCYKEAMKWMGKESEKKC